MPASIPRQPLGKDGPLVPRMGLGLAGLSGFLGEVAPDQERLAFLSKAHELGQTFWDSADEYKDSEDLLGKWFAANPSKRSDIFLATKFGVCTRTDEEIAEMSETSTMQDILKKHYVDSSPEYCRRAMEKSLKRLGLPYVDLYYPHRLDKITPIEKTIQAMVELQKEGKIRHIGLSECSADSLRRACAVARISAVQVEYSPSCTEIESEQVRLLETARELGVAIVAYSPLGQGLLTGAFRTREDFTGPGDMRGMLPSLQDENFSKNLDTLDRIAEVAKSKRATQAQVVFAWVLSQGDDIFPIPGTSNARRLEENLGALNVKLSSDQEQTIRSAGRAVLGGRIQAKTGYSFADTPAL